MGLSEDNGVEPEAVLLVAQELFVQPLADFCIGKGAFVGVHDVVVLQDGAEVVVIVGREGTQKQAGGL